MKVFQKGAEQRYGNEGTPFCLLAVADSHDAVVMKLFKPDNHPNVNVGATLLVCKVWNKGSNSIMISARSKVVVQRRALPVPDEIVQKAQSLCVGPASLAVAKDASLEEALSSQSDSLVNIRAKVIKVIFEYLLYIYFKSFYINICILLTISLSRGVSNMYKIKVSQ